MGDVPLAMKLYKRDVACDPATDYYELFNFVGSCFRWVEQQVFAKIEITVQSTPIKVRFYSDASCTVLASMQMQRQYGYGECVRAFSVSGGELEAQSLTISTYTGAATKWYKSYMVDTNVACPQAQMYTYFVPVDECHLAEMYSNGLTSIGYSKMEVLQTGLFSISQYAKANGGCTGNTQSSPYTMQADTCRP